MFSLSLIPIAALFAVSLGVATSFSLWWGIAIYLTISYLIIFYAFFVCNFKKPGEDIFGPMALLTSNERRIYKRYYCFFLLPTSTQMLGAIIQSARILSIVWFIAALLNGFYILAIANSLLWLITGLGGSSSLMVKLSPVTHLNILAAKHPLFADELYIVHRILERRDMLGI